MPRAHWLLFLVLAAPWVGAQEPEPTRLQQLLGDAGNEGFQRAIAPRTFSFPADHGAHDGYRNEWWYFTGNLADADGRRFGFQLTFFRIGLFPSRPQGESAWRNPHVWMAHFALTDVTGKRFRAAERFARPVAGQAGIEAADGITLWLDNWRLEWHSGSWHLQAEDGGQRIDLQLRPTKPVVLQGEAGLSRKSATPGNASYYYSQTRLATSGSLGFAGQEFTVSGDAWLDREWSTSALDTDQVGWDWFSLQLDDGRDLMLYRLRRHDGTTDPFSAGTLVAADGTITRLRAEEFRMQPLDYWQSPRGGRYPSRWRLQVPNVGLELTVTPLLKDQELDLRVRYWEGAVRVEGSASGLGYMELTSYDTL